MTIDYYRNFMVIADTGSISGASNILRIAQPALSNQLKAMEQEFGCQLVVRRSRGVVLTEAGKILYQKAKAMIGLEQTAKREIQDRLRGVEGTLSIALPPTSSSGFLNSVFSPYRRDFPNVRLELYELNSDEVARYVREGTAEIGFIRAPIRNAHLFEIHPMRGEEIVACVPEAHPLAKKQRLSAIDLQQTDIAIPRGCTTPIQELCARHSFVPNFTFVTTSRTVAVDLSRLFGCIALIPEGEGEFSNEFAVRRFSSESPMLPRALILRKDAQLSMLAQNFLRYQIISLTE